MNTQSIFTNNFLFDLKIRELELLNKNFTINNDILIINEKQPVLIGCRLCYLVTPIATIDGYEINGRKLINHYEKFGNLGVPSEIANKIWMCPMCFCPVKSLIPKIEYIERKL